MENTRSFVKRLLGIYKPFKWAVFGVFGFIIVQQALSLSSPYFYGKAIDALTRKDFSLILQFALIVFVLQVVSTVVGLVRDRFELKNIDYAVSQHVANETLKKIFTFSIGQHHSQNSSIKQSIINKGESALRQFAYSLLYDVMPMVFQVILTIGVLFYLSHILGLIVFIGVLAYATATLYSNSKVQSKLKKMEEMQNDDSKRHSEILRNIEAVKVNAQESRVQKEYNLELDKTNIFSREFWAKFVVIMHSRNIIINLTDFLVITIGAYMVIKGMYTIGYLFIFLSWTSSAVGRIGSLGSLQRRLITQYASIKELHGLMDIKPDIEMSDNPIVPKKIVGEIEFKNVSFEYPKREPLKNDGGKTLAPLKTRAKHRAISSINFKINPGEKVAFVGESGAGKSTIINLLIRAYDPQKGQVLIDGNDLKDLDLKKYREGLGVVEQHVTLFDRTLRYNIVFGCNGKADNITDDKLHELAKTTCIDKFYHRLEHGFNTVIGEKGIKLSGGERQRVGIARALIKEPPILIFDEATSNLDTENEELIRRAIDKASVGRTTIIVAHRLSTIKSVDRIFVIENGELVAKGKHSDLVKTSPRYQQLIRNQVTSF